MKAKRFRACVAMTIGLLAAWIVPVSSQAEMIEMDLPFLADRAQHVVTGQVLSVDSAWNDDHTKIFTTIRLQVKEDLKGNVRAPDSVLTLTELGGAVGETTMIVEHAPSFVVGEEVLVFTETTPDGRLIVLGRTQGKITLKNSDDPAVRSAPQGTIAFTANAQQTVAQVRQLMIESGHTPRVCSISNAPSHGKPGGPGTAGKPADMVEVDRIADGRGGGRDGPPRAISYWYVYPSSGDTSTTFVYRLGNDTYYPGDFTEMCGQVSIDGGAWINMPYIGTYGGVPYVWEYATTLPAGSHTYQYRFEYYGCGGGNIWWTGDLFTGPDVYCAASGGCDEYISGVQVGSINNTGTGCGNYVDYTSLSTTMNIGTGYSITVTNGNPYSSDQCGIWVDWNQDEDFYDAGEAISVSGTPGNGPYTATITPPTGAATGNTRMRIRITYTGTVDPCGTTTYGEVEDYTINVQAAALPNITGVSPDHAPAGVGSAGPAGSLVTVTGTNFGATQGSSVIAFWNGTNYTYDNSYVVSWSDTQIQCYVPGGCSSKDFGVYKDFTTWSNFYPFTVDWSFWYRWQDQSVMPVTYYINENGTADVSGDGEFTAVHTALDTWEDVESCYMFYDYQGTTSLTATNNDGSNVVSWTTTGWSHGSGVIGVSTIWFSGDYIIETDMEFNDAEFTFTTAGAVANQVDVQNVATHEGGHGFMGLSDLYGTPDTEKTMYGYLDVTNGEDKKRSLESDDIAGAQWIYPYTEHAYSCGTYDFGTYYPSDSYVTHGPVSIDSSGDRWYQVYLYRYTQYRFTFCEGGGSFSGDTVLELWPADCSAYVAYNDDYSGCGLGSQIDYVPTTTGYYYLKVRPCAHGSPLKYKLAYRWIPGVCTACPGSDYSITPTTSYQTHASDIYRGGCKQYAVSMTAGRPYRFTFCEGGGTGDYDTYLILRDSGGTQVAYNDDSCSVQSQLDYDCTSGGTYYLEVNSCCTGASGGTYTLAYKCGECLTSGDCAPDGNECTDDLCSGSGVDRACTYPDKTDGTYCGGSPSGDCDAQDTCQSGTCIENYEPGSTICRADAGDCDVPEYCTGSSTTCPGDSFEPSGTYCGGSPSGDCDAQNTCNATGSCITNYEPDTTICRADAGDCDLPEYCTGSSPACPSDDFEPSGTYCGGSPSGDCDAQNTCNATGSCITNYEPDTTICRADAGDCDVPEYCTGSSTTCPGDSFEPNGTYCGGSPSGDCDAQDTCDGSGTCIENYEPGSTICRADAGDCDVPEYCTGSSTTCPGDSFEPSGTACGDPSDADCDNPDTCDGYGTCLVNHEDDGTGCDDEDICTCNDVCASGVCSGTPDTLAPNFTFTPSHVTQNADAGGCEAVLSISPATADDDCDTDVAIDYERSDNPSLTLSDPFPATGYGGPVTITWTATDDCGRTATHDQYVTIDPDNDLILDVQLLSVSSVTRCITFQMFDCDGSTQTIEDELAFTSGLAGSVPLTVACGDYDCIVARDRLHTLARRRNRDAGLNIASADYVASFTGGDHNLIGGDLNDDNWVDIIDFGIYVNRWGDEYGTGDTTCSTPAYHADINGGGEVDTADFTFIQIYFMATGDGDCCGGLLDGGDAWDGPRSEISVTELEELGLAELAVADLNGDGWLDESDIVAFMDGARPDLTPTPKRPDEDDGFYEEAESELSEGFDWNGTD